MNNVAPTINIRLASVAGNLPAWELHVQHPSIAPGVKVSVSGETEGMAIVGMVAIDGQASIVLSRTCEEQGAGRPVCSLTIGELCINASITWPRPLSIQEREHVYRS